MARRLTRLERVCALFDKAGCGNSTAVAIARQAGSFGGVRDLVWCACCVLCESDYAEALGPRQPAELNTAFMWDAPPWKGATLEDRQTWLEGYVPVSFRSAHSPAKLAYLAGAKRDMFGQVIEPWRGDPTPGPPIPPALPSALGPGIGTLAGAAGQVESAVDATAQNGLPPSAQLEEPDSAPGLTPDPGSESIPAGAGSSAGGPTQPAEIQAGASSGPGPASDGPAADPVGPGPEPVQITEAMLASSQIDLQRVVADAARSHLEAAAAGPEFKESEDVRGAGEDPPAVTPEMPRNLQAGAMPAAAAAAQPDDVRPTSPDQTSPVSPPPIVGPAPGPVWSAQPDGSFRRSDGLDVLRDGGTTWYARHLDEPTEGNPGGWLMDKNRIPRRRNWGKAERAMEQLDDQRPVSGLVPAPAPVVGRAQDEPRLPAQAGEPAKEGTTPAGMGDATPGSGPGRTVQVSDVAPSERAPRSPAMVVVREVLGPEKVSDFLTGEDPRIQTGEPEGPSTDARDRTVESCGPASPPASDLTAEAIDRLLRESVPGAEELDGHLKRVVVTPGVAYLVDERTGYDSRTIDREVEPSVAIPPHEPPAQVSETQGVEATPGLGGQPIPSNGLPRGGAATEQQGAASPRSALLFGAPAPAAVSPIPTPLARVAERQIIDLERVGDEDLFAPVLRRHPWTPMVPGGLSELDLRMRTTGITGTDIGSLINANPWKSAFRVWLEKRGQAPPVQVTDRMEWGLWLEPVILSLYCRSRAPGVDVHRYGTIRSPQVAHELATLDASLALAPERIVEAKHTSTRAWEEVHPRIIAQVHWQAGVLADFDLDVDNTVHIPVLVANYGLELTVWEVEIQEDYLAYLREVGERFWHDHVERDLAPPVGSQDDDTLEGRWPSEDPSWVHPSGDPKRRLLEADEDAERLYAMLPQFLEERALAELGIQRIYARLQDKIGHSMAPGLRFADGHSMTWKRSKDYPIAKPKEALALFAENLTACFAYAAAHGLPASTFDGELVKRGLEFADLATRGIVRGSRRWLPREKKLLPLELQKPADRLALVQGSDGDALQLEGTAP